jgi:hypothetical protein
MSHISKFLQRSEQILDVFEPQNLQMGQGWFAAIMPHQLQYCPDMTPLSGTAVDCWEGVKNTELLKRRNAVRDNMALTMVSSSFVLPPMDGPKSRVDNKSPKNRDKVGLSRSCNSSPVKSTRKSPYPPSHLLKEAVSNAAASASGDHGSIQRGASMGAYPINIGESLPISNTPQSPSSSSSPESPHEKMGLTSEEHVVGKNGRFRTPGTYIVRPAWLK